MTDRPQPQDPNTVKALFAALALGSVLAGFMVYLLQDQLGIPSDTARYITTVFVVLGVVDAVVLYLWDRYTKR
jgi:TRAP-type C4-dicarboxylate transport system permease small subunit